VNSSSTAAWPIFDGRHGANGSRAPAGVAGHNAPTPLALNITQTMLAVTSHRALHLPQGHVSAASGLVMLGERLFVVADDELDLAWFDLPGLGPGQSLRLFAHELPLEGEARKAAKPDLESLTWLPPTAAHPAGRLLLLASGSGPRRQQAVWLSLDAHAQPQPHPHVVDLQALYGALRLEFAGLNIEGAFVDGPDLCLLQRGSRRWPGNACVRFDLRRFEAWLDAGAPASMPAPAASAIQHFDLGHLHGVPLAFTDGAALPGGGWVFAAAAEDTPDSYSDGRCAGSAVGLVNYRGDLVYIMPLDHVCKAEGIAANLRDGELHCLLVTDADDRDVPALLLGTTLPWAA
jgi:hypothetical protein